MRNGFLFIALVCFVVFFSSWVMPDFLGRDQQTYLPPSAPEKTIPSPSETPLPPSPYDRTTTDDLAAQERAARDGLASQELNRDINTEFLSWHTEWLSLGNISGVCGIVSLMLQVWQWRRERTWKFKGERN
jgi:hypothetical protein